MFNFAKLTQKQQQFITFVKYHPGCNTAELHRQVGRYYAHGHHKYSYETVDRLLRRKILTTCEPVCKRGVGLKVNE
jgi:hypothetical protein